VGGSYITCTSLDLFTGIPVADYTAALAWYERLLSYPLTFFALGWGRK
jgi:hypothetical protein